MGKKIGSLPNGSIVTLVVDFSKNEHRLEEWRKKWMKVQDVLIFFDAGPKRIDIFGTGRKVRVF